jgi:hypothetical protein
MTLSRAFPLAFALAVVPLWPAAAQLGIMPGQFITAQEARPACEQLLGTRDEVAKRGQALQLAGQKKAPPEELCKLFKAFVAAESKMIKGLEEHSSTCGLAPEIIEWVKAQHGKASETSKRVCELATRPVPVPWCSARDCEVGPRPAPECLADRWGRPSCLVIATDD